MIPNDEMPAIYGGASAKKRGRDWELELMHDEEEHENKPIVTNDCDRPPNDCVRKRHVARYNQMSDDWLENDE